jgi:hypothetical protein
LLDCSRVNALDNSRICRVGHKFAGPQPFFQFIPLFFRQSQQSVLIGKWEWKIEAFLEIELNYYYQIID